MSSDNVTQQMPLLFNLIETYLQMFTSPILGSPYPFGICFTATCSPFQMPLKTDPNVPLPIKSLIVTSSSLMSTDARSAICYIKLHYYYEGFDNELECPIGYRVSGIR